MSYTTLKFKSFLGLLNIFKPIRHGLQLAKTSNLNNIQIFKKIPLYRRIVGLIFIINLLLFYDFAL